MNQKIDSTKSALKTATHNIKQFLYKTIRIAFFSFFIGAPSVFFWGLFASSYLENESTSFFENVLFQSDADPLIAIQATLSNLLPETQQLAQPAKLEQTIESLPELATKPLVIEKLPQTSDLETNTDEVLEKDTTGFITPASEHEIAIQKDPVIIKPVTTKAEVLAFIQDNIESRGIEAKGPSFNKNGQVAWLVTAMCIFMALLIAYLIRIKSSWSSKRGRSVSAQSEGFNITGSAKSKTSIMADAS